MRWSSTPPLVDALLAGVLTVLTVATLYGAQDGPVAVAAVALAVLSVAPLALRQVAPVATMLVIVGAMGAFALLGYGELPSAGVGMVVAMFTVAMLRPRRVAAALYPTTVVVLLLGVDGQGVVWSQVAQAVLVCLGAWILGEGTRRWTERMKHAAVDEERALAAERTRIAQELHDVVSHHMSVVALQTGVAEYVLDTDRETARQAISDAGAASRDALQEMRRMLDALRTHELPAAYSPQPGLADVDTLVDRMRAAGLDVEVSSTGTPQDLPPGLDLCAYRVMQESLTNVLRHAGPARARVLVDHGQRILTVTVLDDGRGSDAGPGKVPERGPERNPEDGSDVGPDSASASGGGQAVGPAGAPETGRGLRGMRERAELYGGTLDAGARPQGGFAVVLRLPVPEGIAASDASPTPSPQGVR